SAGEEGGALPDTRARQPRERVRRPTRRGERAGEPEYAMGDRVQRRLECERRGRTRLPAEVAPAGGDPPRPPLEPFDGCARVEAQRGERALEREAEVRGAGERRGALHLSPGARRAVRGRARAA